MSIPDARQLAVDAHGNQQDRDGSLHIDHVSRVAQGVGTSDAQQRVAWLHDVVEDSDISIEDLASRLPDAELEALRLLTHDDTESYADYVGRIIDAKGDAGELARAIKEADMLDNLRRCALAHDPAIAQYGEALSRLWACKRTPGS
jgi:guanosine-3',5'-bis(diphosphate) 3'-pyrophosphohydrolase